MFRRIVLVAPIMVLLMSGCQDQEEVIPNLVPSVNAATTEVTPTATFTQTASPEAKTPVATQTASSPATPTATQTISVVSVIDPTFQSCASRREPALDPLLANQNLCVLAAKSTSPLGGGIFVYLYNVSSIEQRNLFINQIGDWLKANNQDACGLKTVYLTDSTLSPLTEQVAGEAGEKMFYKRGGLVKPSFCSK